MKLKIIVLILAVLMGNLLFAGCGRKANRENIHNQSIPFLTLIPANVNGEEIKKAYLNFWNLENGKIIKTSKVIYTVPSSSNAEREQTTYETYNGDRPLYWDGKDCIILPPFFKSATNLYKRTETISEVPKVGKGLQSLTRVIFGKDVEMIRIPTGNSRDYRYTVKLLEGKKYIEKELNLNYEFHDTNSQPSYPVAIGNDENNLNILVSGGYNPQTGMDLFLCTVDKKSWISKWHKISVEDDAYISPSKPPDSSNSIYFEGNFYVPSGCCSIAKIDTKGFVCRKWKKIITFKPSEEDIGYSTSILVNFNDTIIVQFIILKGTGNDHYIYAFKNDKELGMIHLINGKVDVMDKDGNVLSNTTLNKNSSIIFPRMNGGM